jgi:hypothetical protein
MDYSEVVPHGRRQIEEQAVFPLMPRPDAASSSQRNSRLGPFANNGEPTNLKGHT